ncbi:hypothetical protein MHOCP_02140 [Moorella humiferrea]|uniref:GGDEF domain-containing protein n=1 Tax=Neomoorella humiferrea TaxID=676965 RepID=UPI0030D1740D
MVERRSREGWLAGLILTVGGILLTLAGIQGPAVWAGLIWSVLNGAALAVEAFRKKREWQYLLLILNLIIAGSWVALGEVIEITALPFFFFMPLWVPLYLGRRKTVVLGLIMAFGLMVLWGLQGGLAFNLHKVYLGCGWLLLGVFFYLAWNKVAGEAARVPSLMAEIERWRREYDLTRSILATVEQLALTDDLTGLFNFRYFEQSLERLLNSYHALNHLALVMLDVDHFKEINDQCGHLVGNRVLKELATILKEHTREQDIVTRFGGEEFAIILPGTGYQGAMQVAERIRRAVAGYHFNEDGKTVRLTVSAGIVVWPEDGTNKEELVARADFALYRAKIMGRNSVCPYRQVKEETGGG